MQPLCGLLFTAGISWPLIAQKNKKKINKRIETETKIKTEIEIKTETEKFVSNFKLDSNVIDAYF